ncbi:hypothetical protein [Nocardiopsis sp. NPDC055824]
MSLIELVRERMHRPCTDLITRQHDALVEHAQARYEAVKHRNHLASEGYRLEEALSEMAEAHADAEEALDKARTEIERLQAELAAEKVRADQAETARAAVENLVAEPLPLTRPRMENQQPVDAALTNIVLVRILLRNEANKNTGFYYGEHLHQLADALQTRITTAHEAIRCGQEPGPILDSLQAPLTVEPLVPAASSEGLAVEVR